MCYSKTMAKQKKTTAAKKAKATVRFEPGRVVTMTVVVSVLTLVFISIDPPKVLFGGFLLYGLSGPTLFLWRWRRHARRQIGNS